MEILAGAGAGCWSPLAGAVARPLEPFGRCSCPEALAGAVELPLSGGLHTRRQPEPSIVVCKAAFVEGNVLRKD